MAAKLLSLSESESIRLVFRGLTLREIAKDRGTTYETQRCLFRDLRKKMSKRTNWDVFASFARHKPERFKLERVHPQWKLKETDGRLR